MLYNNKKVISDSICRQQHLDVVCGILIVYMICWHCEQWAGISSTYQAHLLQQIFFFFMPWFFFKAGMFFKPKQNLKKVFKSSFTRLVIPFISFTILGQLFLCLKLYLQTGKFCNIIPLKGILFYGAGAGNAPLWFLLSLFIIRILATAVEHFCDLRYLLLGGVAALFLNIIDFDKPYWIANVCSGMFFYVLGYFLCKGQYTKKLLIVSIMLYLITLIYPSYVDMNRNVLIQGSYPLWLVSSIAACILINNLFKIFKSNICFRLFSCIGRDSMFFYCTHWIVLIITNIILKMLQIHFYGKNLFMVYFGVILLFIGTFLLYKKGLHNDSTRQ